MENTFSKMGHTKILLKVWKRWQQIFKAETLIEYNPSRKRKVRTNNFRLNNFTLSLKVFCYFTSLNPFSTSARRRGMMRKSSIFMLTISLQVINNREKSHHLYSREMSVLMIQFQLVEIKQQKPLYLHLYIFHSPTSNKKD